MQEDLLNEVSAYFETHFADQAVSIALAGSQAQGLATSSSDIDLILIVKESSELVAREGTYILDPIAGRRAETLIATEKNVQEMVAGLDRIDYRGMSNAQKVEIERLVSAKPVVGLTAWKRMFSSLRYEVYRDQLAADYIVARTASFEDLVGALSENATYLAVEFFRNMLQCEAEALLCLNNDTYGRRKWILKRLQMNAGIGQDLHLGFCEFLYDMVNSRFSTIADWLEGALRFHQKLQFEVYQKTLGFVAPNYSCVDHGTVITRSDLILLLADATWIAQTSDAALSIDQTSALILLACHSDISSDDLSAYLAANASLLSEVPVSSAAEIEAHIAPLLEAGLIVRRANYDLGLARS